MRSTARAWQRASEHRHGPPPVPAPGAAALALPEPGRTGAARVPQLGEFAVLPWGPALGAAELV